MAAYYQNTIAGFLKENPDRIINSLSDCYFNDGYFQLLGTQNKSWAQSLPIIQDVLSQVYQNNSNSGQWGLLLEYPLYRLRKRIDLILISTNRLFLIELKVGPDEVTSTDIRQTEEYALDLRDFHKASHHLNMTPILCYTELSSVKNQPSYDETIQIQPVCVSSKSTLPDVILSQDDKDHTEILIDWREWEKSPYEPVPTIIEAATTIFANHGVKEISKSEAVNLDNCSQEVVRLVHEARSQSKKKIIVVTGVPGAGKTLAGLNVVHQTKDEDYTQGKTIYMSGNTPLVIVLREALAQDEYLRLKSRDLRARIGEIRRNLKGRIQHINDFLKEYYSHDIVNPPFENAIVFDEAQRAWDHKQGKEKFGRDASEPELLMNIMDRHGNWAAIICLVGAGQEINKGEPGMRQWGKALSKYHDKWEMIAPKNAVDGAEGTAGTALFPDGVPNNVKITHNDALQLNIPIRSYRSGLGSKWVDAVLGNRPEEAFEISARLDRYPIMLVRSIDGCRKFLKSSTRGTRRCGLLASAGAVRLVADGLGVSLTVKEKEKIAHWYLKPHGDYRSSNSLEVTANEYTSQGLELDYTGICWGGDFVRDNCKNRWCFRRLHNITWQNVHSQDTQRYILNKYRVFLTRAREGMVIFIPKGDLGDSTRVPGTYEDIADYLKACGVTYLN